MSSLSQSDTLPIDSPGYWPQRAQRLEAALREAVELADEGWAYASDYFVQKWDFVERRNELARVAGLGPITGDMP